MDQDTSEVNRGEILTVVLKSLEWSFGECLEFLSRRLVAFISAARHLTKQVTHYSEFGVGNATAKQRRDRSALRIQFAGVAARLPLPDEDIAPLIEE